MRPETRQTVINAAMLAAALIVLVAIIGMRPAERMARPDNAAKSAAVSTAVAPRLHR